MFGLRHSDVLYGRSRAREPAGRSGKTNQSPQLQSFGQMAGLINALDVDPRPADIDLVEAANQAVNKDASCALASSNVLNCQAP